MKKTISILLIIFICLILGFVYILIQYKADIRNLQSFNQEYEYYYDKTIEGTQIATVINKAINNNEVNNIAKDNKGRYIENESNSIKVEIYIKDNDTTYSMETIYNNGAEQFVSSFSLEDFKCTKIEYHESTKKVKYLLFEQI